MAKTTEFVHMGKTTASTQRCPLCGERLELVTDGEVNDTPAPFYSCSVCEYCATPGDHALVAPPRFVRLFRSQMQRVLYAVICTDGGYVVTCVAAETIGAEAPTVVRRFDVRQLGAACRFADARAKGER